MGRIWVDLLLLQLCVFAAADIVYITDLPAFSSLAPCAQYAISYEVQGLTESACPQGVTALASCACSKNNNAASVASEIASSVLGYCSSTATEDVASASAVFNGQVTYIPLPISQLIFSQILQSRKPSSCRHTRPNIGVPIYNGYLSVFESGMQ